MFVLWSRSERLVRRLPMDDDLVAVVARRPPAARARPGPRPPVLGASAPTESQRPIFLDEDLRRSRPAVVAR